MSFIIRVFIGLYIIGNIVQNGVKAYSFTDVLSGIPCPTDTSNPNLPINDLSPDLFPNGTVQPCKGCEQYFVIKELINEIQCSKLFKLKNVHHSLAPCENNARILAKALEGCSCSEGIEKCDISFIVFILSKIEGQMKIVGQGIRLSDFTILAVFAVTLLGDEGLWVLDHNNVMEKVICVKELKKSSKTVFADLVHTVRLVVESEYCTDCTDCCRDCNTDYTNCCGGGNTLDESNIPTHKESRILIPGYLITQGNCNSTAYLPKPIIGVLIDDPSNIGTSFAVIDQPNQICFGFQGSLFISMDCKVYGIAVAKSVLAVSTVFSVPLGQEIAFECVIVIIPIEL